MPRIVCANEEDWSRERRRGIGGSEVSTVLGLNRWDSPYALWARKLGLVPEQEATERMRMGHRLEPTVAALLAEEAGIELQDPGPFTIDVHPDLDHVRVTVDREVVELGAVTALAELKSTGLPWGAEEPPLDKQAQLQYQLGIRALPRGYLAALVGEYGLKFLWAEMPAHADFQAYVVEAVDEFWQRFIVRRQPPPVDGHDATGAILKLLYPEESGETVTLPSDATGWLADYHQALDAVEAAEARKREAQNRFREALGTATFGQLEDGRRVQFKTVQRGESVIPASSYRQLYLPRRKRAA